MPAPKGKVSCAFKHEKGLFHPVEAEKANPQYAALLQEQLSGSNSKLKAAMQRMSQSFHIKGSFLGIALGEPGHMKMAAQTINLLNEYSVNDRTVPAEEI